MKIGIISDTHDNLIMIRKAVDYFKEEKVDMVIHAGDHVSPFTVMVWEKLGKEVIGVFGNNDGDRRFLKKRFRNIGSVFERPREFIIMGKRILVMHEPDNLREYALSNKYNIIIYGHTHKKALYREGKTLIINPGEGGGWLTGKATAMVLDLNTEEVNETILGEVSVEPII